MQTDIPSELSRKLSNMSLLCACLIVAFHIEHPVSGIAAGIDRVLFGGLSRIAVPVFFTISGYLLAGKTSSENWYPTELLKRVRSLFIPFGIWSLLTVICHLPDCPSFIDAAGLDFTVLPFAYHLWFLRNLFLLVLCSEVLVPLIRRTRLAGVLGLFVIWVGWKLSRPFWPGAVNGFFLYGFALSGLVAFALGIWLRLSAHRSGSPVVAVMALVVGIAFWVGSWKFPGGLANVSISLMLPPLAFGVWHFLPATRLPAELTAAAFPIYLMHPLFIFALQALAPFVPDTSSVAGFFIHWFCPILLSLATSVVLRRYLPRTASFLFGGR